MIAFLIYQAFIKVVYVIAAVCMGVLGYKLYTRKIDSEAMVIAETKFGKFMASGQGPGMFFILTACATLVVTIFVNTSFRSIEVPGKVTKQIINHGGGGGGGMRPKSHGIGISPEHASAPMEGPMVEWHINTMKSNAMSVDSTAVKAMMESIDATPL